MLCKNTTNGTAKQKSDIKRSKIMIKNVFFKIRYLHVTTCCGRVESATTKWLKHKKSREN